MKAAVLYGPHQPLVIEDVELKPPLAREVRVKFVASGVCHSDYHIIAGDVRQRFPVILGHEGAGIVEDVGPGVTYVVPGDHVIASFVPACGSCAYCLRGQANLCEVRYRLQGTLPDGTSRLHKGEQVIHHFAGVSSFAEYAVLPEDSLIKIHPDAPLDKVALVGCAVTTGVGAAISAARVQPGSSVVVYGSGGIGLNVIQGAVLAGAATIIAVDVAPTKLEFAQVFGATHVINASDTNPVEAVRQLTHGEGTDYAFEAIGLIQTIQQALLSVRRGGMAVKLGVTPHGATLTIDPAFLHQDRILRGCTYGSMHPRRDMPMLVDLYMQKKLKLDELVSRTIALEQINDAFTWLLQGEVARSVIVYT